MIGFIINKYKKFNIQHPLYARIFRFLVSGGTSTFTNIFLLYLFTDIFGIWYIISAVMAFIAAFIVSFSLQKFWTFNDMSKDGIHRQAIIYFTAALINLFINAGLLYVFVEYLKLHYLIAQVIISVFIAIENYFIYQFVIFKRTITNPNS